MRWVIFQAFEVFSADFFFQINFFMNTIRVSNKRFESRSGPTFSRGPELGPTCADPVNFVRGGPTLFLLVEGWEDPNTTISGPSFAGGPMMAQH